LQYLFLLLFMTVSFATTPSEEGGLGKKVDETVEKTVDKTEEIVAEASNSYAYRGRSRGSVLVGYEFLSSWIPFKKTLSYTHIFNPKWSLEFEYAFNSIGFPVWLIDIGSISEKRYSLQARRYWGNSFHFIFGAYHSEFEARVGNDILERMSNTRIDEFKVRGTGLTGGIGNRWQWGNGVTFGVDWFRMSIPVIDKKVDNDILNNINDRNDLKDVKDVIDKLKNIPTFVLLGLHLGYSF
jgi:hypothetical protein